MTNTINPQILDGKGAASVAEVLRKDWMKRHAQVVIDAKAAQLQAVRDEACKAFGVICDESKDDEGGGSITLQFPKGWTEEQAERFAENYLDLDLSYRYGGPGRYFQSGGVGTSDSGVIFLGMRWGLDI